MLERAAGCLEYAGQGVLHTYKGVFRSQTSLDHAFWKYHIYDTDSTLWRFILHHETNLDQLGSKPESAHDVFLDFLYPRRCYTSTVSSNLKTRKDNMNFQRKRRVPNFVRSYSQTSRSHCQSANGVSRISLRRNSRRAHTSAALSTTKISDEPNLSKVSRNRIDRDYDRMWELWKTGSQEPGLRSRLMAYFSKSERGLDVERALTLLEDIDLSKRNAEDYEIVMESLLLAGHLSAIERLCEDAKVKDIEMDVWSLAFRTAIKCSKWQELSRIWSTGHEQIHESLTSALSPIEGLCDQVNYFFEFLEQRAPTSGDQQLASHLLHFVFKSEQVMRDIPAETVLSLTRRSSKLGVLSHNHYHDAISTSLRIGSRPNKVMAIVLYRNMRWHLPTYKPRRQLLQQLLATLASLHTYYGVQYLLDEFSLFHEKPSVEGYKSALLAYSRSGDVSKAQETFDKLVASYGTSTKNPLVDHKTPRTPRWVLPLLHAHARLGDYPAAEREFHRIPHIYKVDQNIYCWNALISAHANARNYSGAFRVWRRMHRKGVKPDWYTYGTLMSLCARMGDIENTLALCRMAEKRPGRMPTALMDTVVEAYCRNQRLQEAERVAETCLVLDLDGSRTRMWNVLLWSHAFRADLDSVSRIHNRMKQAGIESDEMSYAALMLSFVIVGQPDSARRLLRGLQRGRRVQATEFHYTLVLYGYVKEGNRDMAYLVYKEMERRFKNPSMSARLLMMRAALGRDTFVVSRETDNPNPVDSGLRLALSEDLLFQAVFDFDRRQFASKYPRPATSSLSVHEAFPASFYEPVLKAYSAEGMHSRAQQLLKEYSRDIDSAMASGERAIVPSLRFLSVLMEVYMQAERFEVVQKCWEVATERAAKMLRRSPVTHATGEIVHSTIKHPSPSTTEGISQSPTDSSSESKVPTQDFSGEVSPLTAGALSKPYRSDPQLTLSTLSAPSSTKPLRSFEGSVPGSDTKNAGTLPYPQKDSIISAQRYILSRHFSLYMGTMGKIGQTWRLPALVEDYQKRGFLMTSQNWLTYVRTLATSNKAPEQLEAFSTFERIFIPSFPGWRRLARGVQLRPPGVPSTADLLDKRPLGKYKGSLGKQASRLWSKLNPTWMYPTYNVMIYLAATLRDFKERSLVEGRQHLDALYTVAPSTLEAIEKMPHLREKFQGVLLRNQFEQGDLPPRKHEDYVWTGGVLGVGGTQRPVRPLKEAEARFEAPRSANNASPNDQKSIHDLLQSSGADDGEPEDHMRTTEGKLEPRDEHDIEIETLIELKRLEVGLDPIEEEEATDSGLK